MRKCVSGVESAKTGWWSAKTAAAAVAAEICPRRGGEFCRKCENGPPPGGAPPGGVRIRTFRKLMQLVATHARARACNSLRAKVLRTFSYTHVAHHTLAHMHACMHVKVL